VTGGSRALRDLSDGLAELYAPSIDGDFPARVVAVTSRLIGSDSCSFNFIGADGLLAFHTQPVDVVDFPDSVQLFRQHLPEHPVLAHNRATGDGSARRISDFLSDRQFRSLGLYRDFYRLAGVDYQLAITVPGPADSLIGIALNRQLQDFTAAELELLNLLRRHVAQAAAMAGIFTSRVPDTSLLTPRQNRILQLVADGHSDRAIGRLLGISTRTVQAHLQHIYRALGVTCRTEALARAAGLTPAVSEHSR
jgi:DNA-binding CsgD family transcriptional regulator